MISVIVPNYNHEPFLPQRLQSIKLQTLKDITCFVLDDCSTDNSRNIIEGLVKEDTRFHLYYNKVNSGSTFSQWNKGVGYAMNEFICIAESDDKADFHLLATLIEPLLRDPEVVLSYCQSNKINEADECTGNWKEYTDDLDKEMFGHDFIMDGKEYTEHFLIHKNTIPNASAVVFRKSVYEKVGGAPEFLKSNGDWLTWLKMLCFGKIAFTSAALNYFRYHNKSVIAKLSLEHDRQEYREQFDYNMRKAFSQFLKKHDVTLTKKILNTNARYMSWDIGNKGLFLMQKGKLLKGWRNILSATFYRGLQTGFIKKALKKS